MISLNYGLKSSRDAQWRQALAQFHKARERKNYHQLLGQTTDEAEWQRIMKLLAEEKKKQRDAGDNADDKKSAAKREVTSYDDTH